MTMPSIQNFTLTYDSLNEHGTFSEGDTITGNVILALSKDTTIESLFVKAKGDADVHWTKKTNNRTRTYSAHRKYFILKQFLIPEEAKDSVVPRGTHVYQFSITIPQQSMPSSFRGIYGKIVYALEAKLSRSWRMDTTAEKQILLVSKSFPDLHSLMTPQVGSTNREMSHFSKQHEGHVHMEVTVDKRAYIAGETIMIVAKVNNSSSSVVTPKFCLIRDIVYHADGNTTHETAICHKVIDNCIKAKTQKEVRCAIQLPSDQQQSIQNCEIISVDYHIKAYLDISFAFDPEVVFPVFILPAEVADWCQNGEAVGPYPGGAAGGQSYSAPPPAYPHKPPLSAGPLSVYLPTNMYGAYSNPLPQQPSPYGSPFSSSSSSSVLHPPPSAPSDLLNPAPVMNTDFRSQSDEAPPSYSVLFPSSSTEESEEK